MPSFQPYWGKPAVRNDRGDRGDVGIIPSPVRASILPDWGRCRVTGTSTRQQDFLPCSYGFRPRRSAHQALRTLQNVLWAKRLYWVLEIDIRKYLECAA